MHLQLPFLNANVIPGWLVPREPISRGTVSTVSNRLEQFRVRVGSETERSQQVYNMNNLNSGFWAGFHLKTRPFQDYHIRCNQASEFWSYRNKIYMWLMQL